MVDPVYIVALFCEDIRQEAGGSITLVGIMQDNINLDVQGRPESAPTNAAITIPKLGVYIRISFDPNLALDEIKFRLTAPDGGEQQLGIVEAAVLKQAALQAREKGNPLAGVASRVILGGLTISKPGILRLDAIMTHET